MARLRGRSMRQGRHPAFAPAIVSLIAILQRFGEQVPSTGAQPFRDLGRGAEGRAAFGQREWARALEPLAAETIA